MTSQENSFESLKFEEVPLPNAPLVRVIAQVRFPTIVSIEDAKFIASFQESLRHEYPILKTEKSLIIDLLNVENKRETNIWRFFDKEEKWRMTLSPEFLALESFDYKNRDDFFGRFETALNFLDQHIKPDSCERIGVRYIDQVKGTQFKEIGKLVRPEVLDIYASDFAKYIDSSLRQTSCTFQSNVKLTARYGVLGQNQTYDPGSVAPIAEPSWVLDLDVYSEERKEFKKDSISAKAKDLSKYAYNFFRWTVTKEFLTAYGGKLS